MRKFLWVCWTLGILSTGITSAQQKIGSFEGTAKEVGPSPYAARGAVGRVLLESGDVRRVAFHVMKDTKITKLVDGKSQQATFADVKKGAELRTTFKGSLMESNPPQAFAIELVIVKAAT